MVGACQASQLYHVTYWPDKSSLCTLLHRLWVALLLVLASPLLLKLLLLTRPVTLVNPLL